MKFFVNDKSLSISYKYSDTIGTILHLLSQKFEHSILIDKLFIDGTPVSPYTETTLQCSLDNIKEISLYTSEKNNTIETLLNEGISFLNLIETELSSGSLPNKSKILKIILWLRQFLSSISINSKSKITAISILRYIESAIEEENATAETFIRPVQSIKVCLFHLKSLLDNTNKILCEEIKSTLNNLNNITESFEYGESAESISKFCYILDLIDACSQYSKNEKCPEMYQVSLELDDISIEILKHFEKRELIKIAELIEQELHPCLETIFEHSNENNFM